MANISVKIDFKTVTDHLSLVDQLTLGLIAEEGDEVELEIDLNVYSSMVYADILLLIVAVVHKLRQSGVTVTGRFPNLNRDLPHVKYAGRIDFFQLLGAEWTDDFNRKNPSGRFIEITPFDNDSALPLHKRVITILAENGVNDDMLRILDYCLWEVMDNSLNHSTGRFTFGEGNGFLCCQFFPKRNEVRLIIADTGVGIHHALTSHPDSEYKELSEEEALGKCIEKGVTNSVGRGFGLWATSTLVRENGGTLLIHSGNYVLKCTSDEEVVRVSNWQGAYTFLRLNTNIPVTYEAIFDSDSVRNNYEDFKEELLDNIEELW